MNRPQKGFTLIELLVVIAIIGVLAAVVLIALNPIEILKKGRDSTRLSDLNTLRSAINIYVASSNGGALSMGTVGTVYASAASTQVLDGSGAAVAVTGSTSRAINGTGWLPINFAGVSGGSPLPTLPVDPTNSGSFVYTYTVSANNGYKITADLESTANSTKKTQDGGNNDSRYEVGSGDGLTLAP